MQKTVQQRVMAVLSLVLGEHESNLKPSQNLRVDLAADSLDLAEIMVETECEFGIEIDEEDFLRLHTVQHVINHVADLCAPTSADVSTNCCACREQKIATLNKAALDCAMEMDWLKNEFPVPPAKYDELTAIIGRVHAASEALYPGEDELEQARRLLCQPCEAPA